MNQDTPIIKQDSKVQTNIEALKTQTSNNFIICFQCIQFDKIECSEKHAKLQKFSQSYNQTIVILQNSLTNLQTLEEDFSNLDILFKKSEIDIQSSFAYKSQILMTKLSTTYSKVKAINFKLQEIKQIIENLMAQILLNDKQEQNIIQLYRFKDFTKLNIFKSIFSVLENQRKQYYKKYKKVNIEALVKNSSLLYVKLGQNLTNIGYYQLAISMYNKALERNPQLSQAYCEKGKILYKLGQYQAAIECENEAIKYNHSNGWPYEIKSLALTNLKKYEESRECYEVGVKFFPNFFFDFRNQSYNLGKIFEKKQAKEKLKNEDTSFKKRKNKRRLNGCQKINNI